MIEFIIGCFVGVVAGVVGLALWIGADDEPRPEVWPERGEHENAGS